MRIRTRINLSVSEELYEVLEKKSGGLPVSTYVNNILESLYLEKPYNLDLALSELIEEAQILVEKNKEEDEFSFTLSDLETFKEYSVARADEAGILPSVIRARLGKLFNAKIRAEGEDIGIERSYKLEKGEKVLEFRNRTAVYRPIKK